MIINFHGAVIEKVQTMADKTIQIRIGLPELPPDQMAEIFKSLNSQAVTVKAHVNDDGGKSPSQRLRAVLFRVWEQQWAGEYPEFEVFYRAKMDNLINQFKDQLA